MLIISVLTCVCQVIDHEEDNLSDKETYSKNIPAIGEPQTLELKLENAK